MGTQEQIDELNNKVASLAKYIVRTPGNFLLVGPPRSGKTLTAKACQQAMKPLTSAAHSQVFRVYTMMQLDRGWEHVEPPLRAPHPTVSVRGLIGQAPDRDLWIPRYGEVTLANHGILFLDDLPKFSGKAIQALIEVLRDQHVTHGTRVGNIEYPAKCKVIAAMTDCPCGNGIGNKLPCTCTSTQVRRWKSRIKPIREFFTEIHMQSWKPTSTR
jgi:magnesium chelatase family protein